MELIAHHCGQQFMPMKTLGDSVTRFALTSGNTITVLSETGDEAYASICDAIDAARTSILLETFIFDRDRIGLRIADRLIAAVQRGVSVRVLIDSVGARYSVPSILEYLRAGKVRESAPSTARSLPASGCPMPISAPTARSSSSIMSLPLPAA